MTNILFNIVAVEHALLVPYVAKLEGSWYNDDYTNKWGLLQTWSISYTTARSGPSTSIPDGRLLSFGQNKSGSYYGCDEPLLDFDLTTYNSPISTAILRLHIVSRYANPPTPWTIEVYKYDFGDTVEAIDWVAGSNIETLTLLGIKLWEFPYTGWIDIPLDPSGIIGGSHTRLLITTDLMRLGTIPVSRVDAMIAVPGIWDLSPDNPVDPQLVINGEFAGIPFHIIAIAHSEEVVL
jgi:hypothetical protein